jgi:hypothetical protein
MRYLQIFKAGFSSKNFKTKVSKYYTKKLIPSQNNKILLPITNYTIFQKHYIKHRI